MIYVLMVRVFGPFRVHYRKKVDFLKPSKNAKFCKKFPAWILLNYKLFLFNYETFWSIFFEIWEKQGFYHFLPLYEYFHEIWVLYEIEIRKAYVKEIVKRKIRNLLIKKNSEIDLIVDDFARNTPSSYNFWYLSLETFKSTPSKIFFLARTRRRECFSVARFRQITF